MIELYKLKFTRRLCFLLPLKATGLLLFYCLSPFSAFSGFSFPSSSAALPSLLPFSSWALFSAFPSFFASSAGFCSPSAGFCFLSASSPVSASAPFSLPFLCSSPSFISSSFPSSSSSSSSAPFFSFSPSSFLSSSSAVLSSSLPSSFAGAGAPSFCWASLVGGFSAFSFWPASSGSAAGLSDSFADSSALFWGFSAFSFCSVFPASASGCAGSFSDSSAASGGFSPVFSASAAAGSVGSFADSPASFWGFSTFSFCSFAFSAGFWSAFVFCSPVALADSFPAEVLAPSTDLFASPAVGCRMLKNYHVNIFFYLFAAISLYRENNYG